MYKGRKKSSGGDSSGVESHGNDSGADGSLSGDGISVSSTEGSSDGSGGEDTDSTSSSEGILGGSGSSDSEDSEDEIEEASSPLRHSLGSIQFVVSNPNREIFGSRSCILSFINMVAVSYMLNGNMSGLASFLTFISSLVGIHVFRAQIMPRVREYVMNHPDLQVYIGPVVGVHRRNRDSLVGQLRGPTEVNIAAITMNLLVSGLSGFLTARSLELGSLSGVGGSAVYYHLFNRLIAMVASYIDNGSDELRNRIINALAMFGSEIRDRVGIQAVLRWVRDSMPRSQDPLPSRTGEAVRRQGLQERGADIVSAVAGAVVFFSNISGSGVHWAAILGSFAWGGTRLPLFAYMGLMRMAQQAEIRARFLRDGNNDRLELARALVLGGSATFFLPEEFLATIGILGGRLLGIMKWIPLILISKALPSTGQKMLLSVIGTNVAASTINLAYAVEAILDPNVPPEDVLNRVHDNSPVGKLKRTTFFSFWVFVLYVIIAATTAILFKKYDVVSSTDSLKALYTGIVIFGVVFMVIMTLIAYSKIDIWGQKAENNCCIRPLLKSACFRGWWGYTGGSEGQTPEEREATAEAQRREDAILEEEANIGMRGTIRNRIRRHLREASVPPEYQNRTIPLQDGTNMILTLIGDANHLSPNTDFLRYNVESPVQDPTTLHIREVRISTRANNNYTLEMSDGRAIIREGEDIRIMDRDGNEEYNSATEPAEGPQLNLQDLVGNLMGAPDLSVPEDTRPGTPEVDGVFVPTPTRRESPHDGPRDNGSVEDIDLEEMSWDGEEIFRETRVLEEENGDTLDDITQATTGLLEEENDATASELGDAEGEDNQWVDIDVDAEFASMNDYAPPPEQEGHENSAEDSNGGCCSGLFGMRKRLSNIRASEAATYEDQPPSRQITISIYEDEDEDNMLFGLSTPLLGEKGADDSSFLGGSPGDKTDQDKTGGSAENPAHKDIKSMTPFALYEHFQENSPETLEIFQPAYDFNLKLEGDEMELLKRDDDTEVGEVRAQMRDTIDAEITVKDVHDYEGDGPIKPERKKREKVIDGFDKDFFKTGPINPKRYDYFNHLESPTKGSHIGDPDECKYEMFGYCAENVGEQLMGAFLLAPMMFASSK